MASRGSDQKGSTAQNESSSKQPATHASSSTTSYTKNTSQQSTSAAHQSNGTSVPPYTQEEKDWLKGNFRDEYHMLRDYGLSIYKEEHREEGRLITRGFMEAEREDEEN